MFSALVKRRARNAKAQTELSAILACMIFALAPGCAAVAFAQAAPSAERNGLIISAGATGSGYSVQYGERKMIGITGFVDADTRGHLGIEAENQRIEFRQSANVHVETYSIGIRYHRTFGGFQAYLKGLAGFGDFNFPYNLATGRYLVVTGGGGVDLRLNRRFQIRVADVEYQDWPQFTFGNMTTAAVSSGLRVRIWQ